MLLPCVSLNPHELTSLQKNTLKQKMLYKHGIRQAPKNTTNVGWSELANSNTMLLNTIGDDETHPLANLLETISILIEVYEQAHHPVADSPAHEVLRFLMQEHNLTPNDLPEMGPQQNVLETLNGKLALNLTQIQNLSKRFHVSPAVFF